MRDCCKHPDRDEPKMVCGYPLPCPWHTVTLDASADPATVTIPVTSAAMRSPVRERLGEVAVALSTDCGSLVVRSRKKR